MRAAPAPDRMLRGRARKARAWQQERGDFRFSNHRSSQELRIPRPPAPDESPPDFSEVRHRSDGTTLLQSPRGWERHERLLRKMSLPATESFRSVERIVVGRAARRALRRRERERRGGLRSHDRCRDVPKVPAMRICRVVSYEASSGSLPSARAQASAGSATPRSRPVSTALRRNPRPRAECRRPPSSGRGRVTRSRPCRATPSRRRRTR